MRERIGEFFRRHSNVLLLAVPTVFLFIFMINPIMTMFENSVVDQNGLTFSYFREMFTTSIYWQILWNTIKLSFIVGIITILLGYPVAYLMHKVGPVRKMIIMGCVQIPFWTSLLVRTYAWIVMLQNQGVINYALRKLGLINEPVQLLYNQTGVVITMTYIMLPYMIFSISSVMDSIDPNIITASVSLGATKTKTFYKVFLPLTKSGILSGFFIVFLNTLGYYIVPTLVGGQKSQMFSQTIQNQLSGLLNWNMAASMSIVLVLVTVMIILTSKAITKTKYDALKEGGN